MTIDQPSAYTSPLIARVAEFYESFPYPQYPLLARPRFQDGYAASSRFAGKLYENLLLRPAAISRPMSQVHPRLKTVLLGGSGETLPYVIRRLEPASHRLLCIDLSERSLKRARMRLIGHRHHTEFTRSDINEYLQKQGLVTGPYDHVDLYGVLHHLPDPSVTLQLLESRMAPYGTMRLMVYNSPARSWIRHIQHVFQQLHLSPYASADRQKARELLRRLRDISPSAAERLQGMGDHTLLNDARFADTFFHVREAHISPQKWLDMLHNAGLQIYSLFDRYAELDDLPNPLWQPPEISELSARTKDCRFENNLELFVCRADERIEPPNKLIPLPETHLHQILPLLLRRPPSRWFAYEETRDVPWPIRWQLWHRHVCYASGYRRRSVDKLLTALPLSCGQRLARLGAIFPLQVQNIDMRTRLHAPMSESTPVPARDPAREPRVTAVSEFVMDVMQEKGIYSDRRYLAIMTRLTRAQA